MLKAIPAHLYLQLRPTVSPSVRQSNAECNVCVDLRLRRVHILVCVWTAGVRGVQSDQSEAPRQAKHHWRTVGVAGMVQEHSRVSGRTTGTASLTSVMVWHRRVMCCASGCVVECRICNREVGGSNLGPGYFAPRSTQPSIPPGSVNEYQLRLGRQRQEWLIKLVDETQGVQVKLYYPLTMRAIPERLRDASRGEALYKSTTFTFLPFTPCARKLSSRPLLSLR